MSDRPDILVRVGAAFDRSFDAVLADAAKKTERALGTGRGSAGEAAARNQLAIANRTYENESKLNRQIYAQQAKSELELAKLRMRLDSDRNRERQREARAQDAHVKAYYRNMIAENQRAEAAKRAESKRTAAEIARNERAERQASYRRDREIDRFATRTSHRATRFFFPPPEGALGYMKRTALDVARGAGVDFSLAGGVSRASEREKMAIALSNQGWNPDKGSFSSRISAAELSSVANEQADRLGLSATDVLEGLTKFTDVTGDLETAKNVIGDIGLLARATGTNLTDAASAAADMAAQLPDSMAQGDKQKAMQMLLATAAMQGKRGAVEVKDLARYVPKIAAQASSFSGDEVTNMVKLLAIAQTARRYGGAPNAAVASTSVAAMVNTLKTPARVAQFKEHGVEVYGADGRMRDIQSIIKESIVGAKNTVEFKKMWANVQGARAVEGYRSIYNKAGGGKAGLDAVDAEFAKYTAALDPAAQQQMLGEALKGTASKAQLFQNALDRVTERMSGRLLTTLERAEPSLLKFVEVMGTVVTWAAENPGKAILAAMTASIARAGLESVGRLIIDRVMASFAGQALGGATGSAIGGIGGGAGAVTSGGGVIGALGTVAALAAVGAAAFSVTTALLELADASSQKTQQERSKSLNEFYFGATEKMSKAANPIERQQILSQSIAELSAQQQRETGSNSPSNWSKEARDTLAALQEFSDRASVRGNEARKELAGVGVPLNPGQAIHKDELAFAIAGALTGKTMNVTISNVDDFNHGFTPVDPNAPARFFQ